LQPLTFAMTLALPALGLLCEQAVAQTAATSTLPTVTVHASKITELPGSTPLDKANLAVISIPI
jgi:hypothetical protein